MRYIEVNWIHNSIDDPIKIYAELNISQWEQRKVEIFRDGRVGYADQKEEVGGSILGLEPWPDLKKLAAEPEFRIKDIAKSEFEQRWDGRK